MQSNEPGGVARRPQALMIGHGALVLVVGLLSGFGLMFALLGEVAIWPIPWTLDLGTGDRSNASVVTCCPEPELRPRVVGRLDSRQQDPRLSWSSQK